MIWHVASNFQFQLKGLCWNIYIYIYTCTCPFFSRPEGFFFFIATPEFRPDTSSAFSIGFFYQNYLVHWFIPFFSLSLFFFLSFACGGALCDQRRNHRAWISTRYRLSLRRERERENRRWTDQIYYFRGKSGTGGCFKAGSESRCGYLPDDCSFRHTKQLSDCFHVFIWSLKRVSIPVCI